MPVECLDDPAHDHVAHLELDFGDLNLLAPDAIADLRAAPALVPDDVSVLTVTAASDDASGLSAGLDLHAARDLTAREAWSVIRDLREAIEGIRNCRAVTVCGCGSYAFGAGLELAVACDVRVATADAEFALPEIDVGLVTGIHGGLLVRLVGLQRAKEMIYTGDPVTGAEAAEMGLVNDAVPADAYRETLDEWVDRLAAKSPLVLQRQKDVFRSWRSVGVERGVQSSFETIAACFGTHDQREGMDAFLEGREAAFEGK